MKTILFIARYINYVFTAKNKHIAHSPFLYQFITKVLNQTSNDRNCKEIIKLRKKLCNSDESIQISDFGAGSHINKAKKRKIKDIAKNSSKNKKFGELLYRITKYYNPLNIIELGTSLGISTLYLAKGASKSKVYTFEGCPETTKIAKKNFKEMNVKNVNITLGNFKHTLQKKLKEIQFIESYQIKKIYPNNLRIKIIEKKPIAIIQRMKQKKYFTDRGDLIDFRDIKKFKDLLDKTSKMASKYNLLKKFKNPLLPLSTEIKYILFNKSKTDCEFRIFHNLLSKI